MAIPTGAPFSKYIEENILTPLISRLDFVLMEKHFSDSEDREPDKGTTSSSSSASTSTSTSTDDFIELITTCLGDLLQKQFGKIGKRELPLAEFFNPVEKHIDSICKDIDAGKLKRSQKSRLEILKDKVVGIRDAIVEPYKTEDGSASTGGGGQGPALATGAGPQNRIRVAAGDGEEMAHLRRAVNGMDEPLKCCLLSLAAFPEGAVIKRRLLIHWWIGEKLVENVVEGKESFKGLIGMKFIRATATGRQGSETVNSCTVHPWIHRVIVAVANSSAFMEVVVDPGDISSNDFKRTRRACLRNGKTTTLPPASRSELGFHSEVLSIYNIDQQHVKLSSDWFAKKTSLRTLQLGQWRVSEETNKAADAKKFHVELINDEHLKGIGACRNLRYLSLRGISRIDAIPDAVGKLSELIVLDLRACYNLQKLTKEITKLQKLQYLDVSECYLLVEMPQGLGKMSDLQVLKGFVVASTARKNACRLSELVGLQKMNKLSICIGKKMMAERQEELSKLAELIPLKSLRITWAVLTSEEDDAPNDGGATFSLPPKLVKLDLQCFPFKKFSQLIRTSTEELSELKKLYVTGGLLDSLQPLCEARKLEVLHLRFLNHLKLGDYEQLCAKTANYPHLKIIVLHLRYLNHLVVGDYEQLCAKTANYRHLKIVLHLRFLNHLEECDYEKLRANYRHLKIIRDPGSTLQNASSQMDRSWMYPDDSRMCKEYIAGLCEFKSVAEEHMRNNNNDYMYCPCIDCDNEKKKKPSQVHMHLLLRGFTKGYRCWTKHGESDCSVSGHIQK